MVEQPQSELEREVAALYGQYSTELYRFAALILRPQDGAGDAVQETFLRYFAERKCGGEVDNPRAWLYRVLHNYLMDRLGRAAARLEVSSDLAAEPVDLAHDPEELVARSQVAREIAAGLTGRELDCLRLRAEGLSYEEVAGALGIRSGTVGALLTRVHKKLHTVAGNSQWRRMRIAEALGSLLHDGGTHSS
jgi:RNA polymerase sigma-70 factor (ECF subfamily)